MKQNLNRPRVAWLLGATLMAGPALAMDTPPPPTPPTVPDLQPLHARIAAEVEHVSEMARHAQEAARRTIALAQAGTEHLEVDVDLPEPPEPPFLPRLETQIATMTGDLLGGEAGGAEPLLVATALGPEKRDQIHEDLKVMRRILEKAAERAGAGPGADRAMGIMVWTASGRSAPRTLYLEGFGAVFLLNVKYPLVAPPAGTPGKEEADQPDNSVWEETRRELYERNEGGYSTGVDPFTAARYGLVSGSKERGVPFSAAKVEALKAALIEAAQNAANIRNLGADERVVIVAQGPATPSVKNVEVNKRYGTERVRISATGGGPQTTLVMRFKKADAEALATGKLNADEFTKKVEIAAY